MFDIKFEQKKVKTQRIIFLSMSKVTRKCQLWDMLKNRSFINFSPLVDRFRDSNDIWMVLRLYIIKTKRLEQTGDKKLIRGKIFQIIKKLKK